MTRPKTISNENLLAVARKVFREHGSTASTRAIASAAGISEGVLYQRFGSKEDLFFASMAPQPPDIEGLLGPEEPSKDAPKFLKAVLVRMAKHFGEVIPLALQIMTHPAAHHSGMERALPSLARLHQGLVVRLESYEARKLLRPKAAPKTAQMLISLAHDWALGHMGLHPRHGSQDLEEMAELLWVGVRR